MDTQKSRFKWWYVPLGLVTLFLVVYTAACLSAWIAAIRGTPYSEEEALARERLGPLLDSIVTGEEDLTRIAGDFYSCGDDSHGTVQYDLGGGSGKDVQGVEAGTRDQAWETETESEFCDYDSETFVNSVLWLPPRKDYLLHTIRVYTDLSNGDSEELSLLVDAAVASQFKGLTPYDGEWVEVPELGTHRYAFKFKIAGGKYSEPYSVYAFFFVRGVASGSVGLAAPSREITDSDAASVAEAMDAELKIRMTSSPSASTGDKTDP